MLVAQEVGILKGLNYDRNIVQFYGAVLPAEAAMAATPPMLVMEYMAVSKNSMK